MRINFLLTNKNKSFIIDYMISYFLISIYRDNPGNLSGKCFIHKFRSGRAITSWFHLFWEMVDIYLCLHAAPKLGCSSWWIPSNRAIVTGLYIFLIIWRCDKNNHNVWFLGRWHIPSIVLFCDFFLLFLLLFLFFEGGKIMVLFI